MELGLRGRTAVVGGASAGIGLGVAEALAAEGANVAMFARGRDALEREAARLGGLAVAGDASDPADLERLVATTVERFGGVDVLVVNAGGPPRIKARDLTDDDVRGAVDLLLLYAVRLVRLCLPHLEASPAGRIVTITSSSAREPIDNLALSNAIRPGIAGWSKTLARELGPQGITVNTVAPGRIETERLAEVYPDGPTDADLAAIPLRRFGQPRELGDVVAFLASDRAAYVTGQSIVVDGGLTRGL